MRSLRVFAVALFVLIPTPLVLAQTGAKKAPAPRKKTLAPRVVTPEAVRWASAQKAAPAGAQIAILAGNPNSSGGPFLYRIKALDGSSVGPHWHTTDVHLTVLHGAVVFSEGAAFDESKAQTIGPESYLYVPRGMRYILAVKGETIYQINGMAPLKTNPVKGAPPVLTRTPTGEEKQKAEFDAALAGFNQAQSKNDRAALSSLRREFERIARSGGRYAGQAQEYLASRFPLERRGPCPAIPRPPNTGWNVQVVRPGDVIAPALLDQKLEWMQCPTPAFPPARATGPGPRSGVVRLTVLLNENGTVLDVKPRGGLYPPGVFEAAAAAVRLWRTNPPRAKAQPVKTEVSMDIPYSP